MNRKRKHPTHSELNRLLDEVEAGTPIDSDCLRKLISKNHINLNHFLELYGDTIDATTIGKKPANPYGWQEWRRRTVGYATDRTSKITASATGDSHSVRSTHSMIVCWPKGSDSPQVAYWEGQHWLAPTKTSREAIILENETLFLMRQATLEGLRTWFEADYSEMDWVFAGGNSISKASNREFLSRYQKLHVMTDMDLGGLVIFNNLQNLMTGSKTELAHVFPERMQSLLQIHGKPFDAEYGNRIRKLLPRLRGDTLAAAKLLLSTGLRAEQEILLGATHDR